MSEVASRPASSFFRSWVLPIGFILGISAGVAWVVSRAEEWSFPAAFGVVLLVFGGLIVWTLGTFWLYERAATNRGWKCETGPTATSPDSDIRIEGTFEGAPFRLTRHKSAKTSRRDVVSSALEWSGSEIRVPAFTLHITRGMDATIDRVVGARALIGTIQTAVGHAPPAPLPLPAESTLARRAELTSPDAAAAEAFFSPSRCEVIDRLIPAGTIDAAPGRITIFALGFPTPGQIANHLARNAEVRRALVS